MNTLDCWHWGNMYGTLNLTRQNARNEPKNSSNGGRSGSSGSSNSNSNNSAGRDIKSLQNHSVDKIRLQQV